MSEMKGGWFIGDFEPSVFRQQNFEVGYKLHHKGEYWAPHTHKIATELTVLISGRMKILGQVLEAGDIFVIYPNEIADPEFLEDCQVIIVKMPSIIGDKHQLPSAQG